MCDPSNVTPSLIFQQVHHQDFRILYPNSTCTSIKTILLRVLLGLDFAHSRGIIHRDIKPGNVLMNLRDESAIIVDWGLADFYHPGKKFNCRVASRYFKGPELLLGNNYYDYQLDVWSAGCMLAGMMFAKEPFFKGTDNDDQLIRIAKVVGADDIPSFLLAAGSLNFPRNRAASFRAAARWPVVDGVKAKVGQYFSSRLKAVRRLSSKTCLHATYSL